MAEITNLKEIAVRTTVDLPPDLARRAERFVNDGDPPTLSALLIAALEHFLVHLEEQASSQLKLAGESLAWTVLSQDAFAEDWDSEEDAIYDDWETHYGLRQG